MLDLPFFLGAQDISPFPAGAYTGAIAAEQLAGLVRYALIGHSERRQYFNETDSALQKKVDQLTRYAIKPIYCVQSAQIVLPPAVSIVAYEPPAAIGTGNPADPSFANQIISRIKQANPAVTSGIYGGSVTAENVAAFLRQPAIDGVLIGKPSLDAKTFIKIIGYASQV